MEDETRMKRSSTALGLAALASLPAGTTWAAAHATKPKATAVHKSTKKTAAKTKTKAKKYSGPLIDMRWGPVKATITVTGKKITHVVITTNPENFRSQFIDQQAVPLLKQETLQTQNANIDLISGATMTSEAYDLSLQRALKKAHLPVN